MGGVKNPTKYLNAIFNLEFYESPLIKKTFTLNNVIWNASKARLDVNKSFMRAQFSFNLYNVYVFLIIYNLI